MFNFLRPFRSLNPENHMYTGHRLPIFFASGKPVKQRTGFPGKKETCLFASGKSVKRRTDFRAKRKPVVELPRYIQ